VRSFVEREVIPLEPALAAGPFAELAPELERVRASAKALGFWGPQLPAGLGGMGLGLVGLALGGGQPGRRPLGHYAVNAQAPDAGNMELLQASATPGQKVRWLEPLARGEIRSAFAMTEPDHPGSNPTWMGTTAARDGDSYVVNGRKWFASGA